MTRLSEAWLNDPATQRVCAALTSAGFLALFVGGCVRNALIGAPVSDLDISTDAHPDRVMALALDAGLKAIPTGIDHGTITVIANGIPHEITTFRKDVKTDGRHAEVVFADTVTEDAARRDFTMNAIYADPDGQVIDPLNGLPDLHRRRVRFIGTAENRIREDYLRSLRYFRFHAWYGDATQGMDPDAIAAIAANLDGIDQLSRERVGAEILKLLGAPDPAPSIATMRQIGVLSQVIPGADDRALAPLIYLETETNAGENAILRLASLVDEEIAKPLRLSRDQANQIAKLRKWATSMAGAQELGYRLGDSAIEALLLRSALLEQPLPLNAQEGVAKGRSAIFPIRAADLMPEFTGPALGARLKQLEAVWIASGMELEKAALLETLPDNS